MGGGGGKAENAAHHFNRLYVFKFLSKSCQDMK